MEGLEKILPYVFTVIVAILGAYVTVKVSMAEMKKDNTHLKERLDTEIASKVKMADDHSVDMKEIQGDVKAIFKTLTTIQVSIARSQGRDEVLTVVKEAVLDIAKAKAS
jgi:hypothetical protein